MSLPSVMRHRFSEVPSADIPRSQFDRSHGYKTTFDAAYLIPIFLDEALPGDTFNLSMTAFARLATPIKPIMDNIFMETFFFAVPYRLVWDNFQKFCGEQDNPDDTTDYVLPVFTTAGMSPDTGHIADYFGMPIGVANMANVVSIYHRAYHLIWNEWFRDQNIQDSVPVDKDDGPDDYANYTNVLRRGKRHDYFTSCLPWPQKGDSVELPLGASAPVIGVGNYSQPGQNTVFRNAVGGGGDLVNLSTAGGAPPGPVLADDGNPTAPADIYGFAPAMNINRVAFAAGGVGLYADLSDATAATINSLRQAFQIQRLLERDARGGTRYTEILRAHFGVVSPDARLQRPEYLGGGSSMVNINPIAQTSSTDDESPQGNLSAMGTAHLSGHGFTKSFTEHCVVIGLVNVRADITYQQGLDRMFSRSTRYDLYWPALSHIGEQAVLNQEIYKAGDAGDLDVFGYQERYAEYRYKPSRVTGLFRSAAADSLDVWHLAQDFETLPILTNSFIEDDPPIDRVIAVTNEPQFLFDAYFRFKCARPMPVFGVPGLIDHF